MMWLEARKQEKKIRCMLVDYKRRAERRKDYYEKIKADPTQFMQVHGRPCKIHLDPAVAIAADSPANMMSWQGNHDIMVDRFDVRAHLDYIPEIKSKQDEDEELNQEERLINYERYRILAQNDFLGVTEEKFLQQLALEEQFGPVEKIEPQPIEGKKKVVGAAIGYNYGEGNTAVSGAGEPAKEEKSSDDENDEEDDEDEDSDVDFDLCVDVNKISTAQAHEMNASALSYGMKSNDFFSFLTKDVEEAENLKLAREREEEKAMFSGRKSRRERRAYREKKLLGRKLSPPSYAASKIAPIADLIRHVVKSVSRSRSRSNSPPNAGMIQYITSFGGEETPLEPPPPQIIKTSVHTSKEDNIVYKRTVRYRSSGSPESPKRRERSTSAERLQYSQERDRRKSRSQSPNWRSGSPTVRKVRYRSRSRSPVQSYRARSPDRRSSSEKGRGVQDRLPESSYSRRYSPSSSKSPSPTTRIVKRLNSPQPKSVEVPAPPVITRYYGRHRNQSSSSELDLSDSEDKIDKTLDKISNKSNEAVGNSSGRSKPIPSSSSKVSVQELLKKKRQALINRQYKADKRAERLRLEKVEQERQDREDEMRELSIKMRRRERQKRHQYYDLDETNAADKSDNEDGLSDVSSQSGSDKQGSDSEHRTHTQVSRKYRDEDSDRPKKIKEKERSRERDSRRDGDSRRDSDSRREKSKDRSSKRSRDEDNYRDKERPKERLRERSREKYRRDRDRSKDKGRDRSRERERNSSRRSKEKESSDSGGMSIKKPFRPLVDY